MVTGYRGLQGYLPTLVLLDVSETVQRRPARDQRYLSKVNVCQDPLPSPFQLDTFRSEAKIANTGLLVPMP